MKRWKLDHGKMRERPDGEYVLLEDVQKPDACTNCDGSGEVPVGCFFEEDDGWTTCQLCGGTGVMPTDADIMELREECRMLRAEGHMADVLEGHVDRLTAKLRGRAATIRRLLAEEGDVA